MRLLVLLCASLAVLLPSGCAEAPLPAAPPRHELALRHLGSAIVHPGIDGADADFGGISGLDHDPVSGVWYLLSDDRSERAPARFYRAAIELDGVGFRSLRITGVSPLRRADGRSYPGLKGGAVPPDPEALRLDPLSGDIVWSSEGDRERGVGPSVHRVARDGRNLGDVPLPPRLATVAQPGRGPRHNQSVEGLAFTPDGQSLWVAMEAPLLEDGDVPTSGAGAPARFTRLDRQGRVLAQYVYPLDALPRAATGGRLRADNGVSEILTVDADTLLVLERAGYEVTDRVFRFAVRLYEVKLGAATDVAGVDSLRGAAYVPLTKRLLLDLDRAGVGASDNFEAAAWGPRLSNGRRTLVIASDDNFSPTQANRLEAFEVIE